MSDLIDVRRILAMLFASTPFDGHGGRVHDVEFKRAVSSLEAAAVERDALQKQLADLGSDYGDLLSESNKFEVERDALQGLLWAGLPRHHGSCCIVEGGKVAVSRESCVCAPLERAICDALDTWGLPTAAREERRAKALRALLKDEET